MINIDIKEFENIQNLTLQIGCIIEVTKDSCCLNDMIAQKIALEYANNLINNLNDLLENIYIYN